MSSSPLIGLGSVTTCTELGDDLSQDAVIQSIQAACAGGQGTIDYFQTINNMGQLFNQLKNNGRDGWSEGQDDVTGAPIMYVSMDDGNGRSYYIEVAASNVTTVPAAPKGNLDSDGTNVQTNGTTQTINGVVYNGVGTIDMSCGYDNYTFSKTSWWIGTSIAGAVGSKILLPTLWNTIKSVAGVVADKIKAIGSDSGAGEGGEGTESAEESAEGSGEADIIEEGGGEVAVETTVEEGAIAIGDVFVGVGVALAIVFIVLSFVLHNSYHSVRLWNLTQYTMDWVLHFDNSQPEEQGKLVKGPVTFNNDSSIKSYVRFLPLGKSAPAPHVKPVNQCHYYDMNFVCSHEFSGIGYALQIWLKDTSEKVVYTSTIYFDIPWIGDNSTGTSTEVGYGPSDLQSWYNNNSGKNKATAASSLSGDGVIKTMTTFDYLSGQHPVPDTPAGQSTNQQYYYQSVVTILQENLMSGAQAVPELQPRFKATPKSTTLEDALASLSPSLRCQVFKRLAAKKIASS